jgi:hypothetical protein
MTIYTVDCINSYEQLLFPIIATLEAACRDIQPLPTFDVWFRMVHLPESLLLVPPTGRAMLAQSSFPAEKPLGSHLDTILSKHQNLFRWQ